MKIYSKMHGSEGAPHGQVMASTGYHVVRGGPEWVQNDPYNFLSYPYLMKNCSRMASWGRRCSRWPSYGRRRLPRGLRWSGMGAK